jgi:hypothetical protein
VYFARFPFVFVEPVVNRTVEAGAGANERSSDQAAEVQQQLARLENLVKERETFLLRAIKTFVEDVAAYASGRRKEFPQAALLGLVFAYMRPRVVLIVGSMLAALMAAAQVYFLVYQTKVMERQNTLMEGQNRLLQNQEQLLRRQTDASQQQAIAMLMSSLAEDETSSRVAISQLATYGEVSVMPLLSLATLRDTAVSEVALTVLFQQHRIHTPQQVMDTLRAWRDRYPLSLRSGESYTTAELAETIPYLTDPNIRPLSSKAAIVSSATYLRGLRARCTAEPAWCQTLKQLLSQEVGAGTKLIRDLYTLTLNPRVTKNMAASEKRHADAITLNAMAWSEALRAFCYIVRGQTPPRETFEESLRQPDDKIKQWLGIPPEDERLLRPK